MRPPFTLLALTALALACGPTAAERQAAAARARADSIARAAAESAAAPLPGMPPIDSTDVYAAAGAGMVDSAEAAGQPAVYVPLGGAGSVAVIDPRTYKVVRRFATGILPQHVVPSYDQRRLWVANDRGNSLTPIDPRTAQPGKNITVADPYNLYFTPDGRNLGGGGVKQGAGITPEVLVRHGVDGNHGLEVALHTLAAKAA